MNVALRDPHFRHLRNIYLSQYLEQLRLYEQQVQELQKIFAKIDPSVYRDKQKASIIETFVGFWRVPYSNNQYEKAKITLFNWIKERNLFLTDQLQNTQVRFHVEPAGKSNQLVTLTIDGHSAALLDPREFQKTIIFLRTNRGWKRLDKPMLLHPGLIEGGIKWEHGKKVYDFELTGAEKIYELKFQTEITKEAHFYTFE